MAVVDLHLHTAASDGILRPGQMVRFAARRGLRVVSVADHDSTEGVAEALETAKEFPEMELIPGVELSTDVPEAEVHVLGYFIDFRDQGLLERLERFRNGRVLRARRMTDKLAALGMKLDWSRVMKLAGDGSVGRPHIAQAMLEAGYVSQFKEAFEKYIGRNGPAYVGREKLTPVEAVKMLIGVRGLPVLAHPGDLPDLERVLQELMAAGLVGMETYYGNYRPERVRLLEAVAAEHGLVPCGGSDYHGLGTPDEVLPGEIGPPLEVVETLRSIWQEKNRVRGRTNRTG